GQTVSYTARIEDANGNINDAGTPYTATVDTEAPLGTIAVTPKSTIDTTPTISGTVNNMVAGEKVWVRVDGHTYKQESGEVTVTGNTWSVTIPNDRAINVDGQSNVKLGVFAWIVDEAGNFRPD